MRFNHMEMTFPIGSLTESFQDEIDAFYGSIFGWRASLGRERPRSVGFVAVR